MERLQKSAVSAPLVLCGDTGSAVQPQMGLFSLCSPRLWWKMCRGHPCRDGLSAGTRSSRKVISPRDPLHTCFQKMNQATLVLTHIFSPRGLFFYGNGSILELGGFFSQKFREITAGEEFARSSSAVHAIKPIMTTHFSCVFPVFQALAALSCPRDEQRFFSKALFQWEIAARC